MGRILANGRRISGAVSSVPHSGSVSWAGRTERPFEVVISTLAGAPAACATVIGSVEVSLP
jgi:hypothetical protein